MKFHLEKRQIPAIPIVALIDILVILLIFFIVTMQPKKKRDLLNVSMPVVSEIETEEIVEPRTVLAMDADGQISLNGIQVDLASLVDYLKVLKEGNSNTKLEMELDRRVRLEQMISISEALRDAGFDSDLPTRVKRGS